VSTLTKIHFVINVVPKIINRCLHFTKTTNKFCWHLLTLCWARQS